MSKAFTKEDVEPPERSGRRRGTAGLPAGAVNYVTAEGAARLTAAELEGAVIVPARTGPVSEALFGTTVVLESPDGTRRAHRIVGAAEADLEDGWVSWVSPFGRQLLGAKVGDVIRPDASSLAPAPVVVAVHG